MHFTLNRNLFDVLFKVNQSKLLQMTRWLCFFVSHLKVIRQQHFLLLLFFKFFLYMEQESYHVTKWIAHFHCKNVMISRSLFNCILLVVNKRLLLTYEILIAHFTCFIFLLYSHKNNSPEMQIHILFLLWPLLTNNLDEWINDEYIYLFVW